MNKSAKVLNWIALVWTILGVIALVSEGTLDIWSFVFMSVLVGAQVTALNSIE